MQVVWDNFFHKSWMPFWSRQSFWITTRFKDFLKNFSHYWKLFFTFGSSIYSNFAHKLHLVENAFYRTWISNEWKHDVEITSPASSSFLEDMKCHSSVLVPFSTLHFYNTIFHVLELPFFDAKLHAYQYNFQDSSDFSIQHHYKLFFRSLSPVSGWD